MKHTALDWSSVIFKPEDFNDVFSPGELKVLSNWEKTADEFANGHCDGLIARGVRIDAGIAAKNAATRMINAGLKYTILKDRIRFRQLEKK